MVLKAVVRHDDLTTTGGRVIANLATEFDQGRRLALSGDRATCGKCVGVWSILGTAAGMIDDGRLFVVDGDHVNCPCGDNKTKAGVGSSIFLVASSSGAEVNGFHNAIGECRESSGLNFSDRYRLRSSDGKVLSRTAYAFRRSDGVFEYGVSDDSGMTHLITSGLESEVVDVYVGI